MSQNIHHSTRPIQWILLICLAIGSVLGTGAGSASSPTPTAYPTSTPYPTGIYYVATDGKDSNPGTEMQPFRTIQHALDSVGDGDKIIVAAGLYRERVYVKDNGVTLEGKPGAIIHGGDVFTGWEPAPEVGDGVYKHTNLPYKPYNMVWNDYYVLRVRDDQMAGFSYFTKSASDSWWDGIEAVFGTSDSVTYVRFRDGMDPDDEDVAFAPQWWGNGAVNINGKSGVTIRGFTIKGAAVGVNVANGASNNVIEDCTIMHGYFDVFLYLDGGRNHVRRNKITLNYLHTMDPGDPLAQHVWDGFKEMSDYNRYGVFLYLAGHDNEIYENEIFEIFDAVSDFGGGNYDSWWVGDPAEWDFAHYCQRLKVYGNYLHEGSVGFLINGGEIDAEWHDNLILRFNVNMAIKRASTGPLYIYRNRCWTPASTSRTGQDIYFYTGTPGKIYFYHNSFASNRGFSTGAWYADRGLLDTWFINNIFSNEKCYSIDFDFNFDNVRAGYNWFGKDAQPEVWMKEGNILATERLWAAGAEPDFEIMADDPVVDQGIDLSQLWSLDGVDHPALPGMEPGYFTGSRPDIGAYEAAATPTPTPSDTLTPMPTSTYTPTPTETATPTPTTEPGQCTLTFNPGSIDYNGSGLSPGTVICLQAGEYSKIEFRNLQGTAQEPIIIRNHGGQVRMIEANWVEIQRCEYIRLTGTGTPDIEYGFYVADPDPSDYENVQLHITDQSYHVEVDHVEMNVARVLAKDETHPDFEMTHINIHHNYIRDFPGAGVYIGDSHYWEHEGQYQMRFVDVHHNVIVGCGDGVQMGSVVEGGAIHHNVIRDMACGDHDRRVAAVAISTANVEIYNNLMLNCDNYAININAAYFPTKIYNNLIINSGYDTEIGRDDAIKIFGNGDNEIHSNTIIGVVDKGIDLAGVATQARVYNNIVLDSGGAAIDPGGCSSDNVHHNLTDEDGYTVTTLDFVDPDNDDFHLTSSSPAVDAGSEPELDFDLDDNPRPVGDAYDIGAFEYAASTFTVQVFLPFVSK